jgi:hypothetical protein
MRAILIFLAACLIGVVQASLSHHNSAMKVSASLDSSDFIAAGTPFEKPKIAESIVDLIGGTPMVSRLHLHLMVNV